MPDSKLSIKAFSNIFILAYKEFKQNDPLRLAGATAFFTTFALPAILIILVQIIGLVFSKENIRGKLFLSLTKILGRDGAMQTQQTFWGFKSLATNTFISSAGFIFLIFVATTLFKIIKDSLNQLWNVRVADNKPAIQLAGSFKNWAAAQIEFNLGTQWSFFAADLYNYGNNDKNNKLHFYNAGAVYKSNALRLQLNYGRQRGGLVCVGGVCRFVPQSVGLNLALNYSF